MSGLGELEKLFADGILGGIIESRDGAVINQLVLPGFLDEFLGVLEGREMSGDAVENRFSLVFCSRFFFILKFLPLSPDSIDCFGVAFSKDMWVSVNELVDDTLRYLVEIEGLSFIAELAVKHDLEEEVP